MTNEEAIAIIKSECYVMNLLNLDRTQMINKALDMAIEALEQQQNIHGNCKRCVDFSEFKPQPCDDAISRQEVISEIDRYIEKAQTTGSRDDFISFQELVVKQMSSVTPTITDVENNYDIGYNCGYADAMADMIGEEE